MHLEASNPVLESRVVIMPNLEDLMKLERSWIFSSVPGSSRFFSLYLRYRQHGVGVREGREFSRVCRLGAGVCIGIGHGGFEAACV